MVVSLRRFFLCTVAFFVLPTAANAAVLNFEGFAAGTIIDNEYSGVTIRALTNSPNSPNAAVVFDTLNPTGGDDDLEAPFFAGDQAVIPGGVLILQENDNCGTLLCDVPDDDARGGTFFFEWAEPILLNTVDFFDIEEDESGAPITVELETLNGALPMFSVPGTGGDNTWARYSFGDIRDVVALTINLNGSGAIDNLRFNVPLPGVAWLFLSGLLVAMPRLRWRASA